jgi:hypothetical protein
MRVELLDDTDLAALDPLVLDAIRLLGDAPTPHATDHAAIGTSG